MRIPGIPDFPAALTAWQAYRRSPSSDPRWIENEYVQEDIEKALVIAANAAARSET